MISLIYHNKFILKYIVMHLRNLFIINQVIYYIRNYIIIIIMTRQAMYYDYCDNGKYIHH